MNDWTNFLLIGFGFLAVLNILLYILLLTLKKLVDSSWRRIELEAQHTKLLIEKLRLELGLSDKKTVNLPDNKQF